MLPPNQKDEFSLSEADIHAYADGMLPPERTAMLRRYLGNRPDEARRVAAYGRLNEQMQRAFTERPPAPDVAGAGKSRHAHVLRVWSRIQYAARSAFRLILIAALILVGAYGWMSASKASYEALDGAAVLALAELATPKAGAPGDNTGAINSPDAPDLTSLNMRLAGVRNVQVGPLASATEFVYMNAVGQPLVLLRAPALMEPFRTPWMARRAGPWRFLSWTAHQQRYVLAGAANTRGLMRAADLLVSR